MRNKIVAGNWKMYGNRAANEHLIDFIKAHYQPKPHLQCVLFPPFIYIPQVQQLLQHSNIQWGAQNLSESEPGAYTGEIAASMLVDYGCKYVLIGHSERRLLFSENNEHIALKFSQALRYNLIPILCIGETLEQRESGRTLEIISNQLNSVLHLSSGVQGFQKAVIAYEPVWAIGTGKTASPDIAQEVHQFIRKIIAEKNEAIANALTILYGGSVKPSNAKALFSMPDIDGGLIGGSSLNTHEFMEIVQCIS